MSEKILLQMGAVLAVLSFVFITTAAAQEPPLLHPCHPGGGGGPGIGPPCPPTATPSSSSGDSGAQADPTGPIGFRLINQTPENITIWLGEPIQYILNVSGESETTFTIRRGVYSYQMLSCGVWSTGFMDLTVQTFFTVSPCEQTHLVKVYIENPSNRNLAVELNGPKGYVVPIRAGQTRSLTIARGSYAGHVYGCRSIEQIVFEARSGRTLEISCP